MTRTASGLATSIGGTLAAWGVAEWNQFAGVVAFSSAAVYSLTKTYLAIRDRNNRNPARNPAPK